jgi:hypothetical protein
MGNSAFSLWEPSEEDEESGLSRDQILAIIGEEYFDEEKYLEATNGRERSGTIPARLS